jgi:hypothetical protein
MERSPCGPVPPAPGPYKDPDGIELLQIPEDVLLQKLGLAEFQLQQYGTYNPKMVIKTDFGELGRGKFNEILQWVRNQLCPVYEMLKANGVVTDAQTIFLFVIPALINNEVHPRLAWVSAAIIARRGLEYFCTHVTGLDDHP